MLPLPPCETAVVGPGVAVKANGAPEEVILAFDVGGTKIAAALGTSSGAILEEVIEPSPAGGEFAAMWEVICALGDRLISGALTPAAIGVSIGGPLDADAGVIYAPPNLPGWGSVPLRRLLEERFGLPSYIQHDAKAGALAEWLFGAGQGCQNLVFLTFGTGLGAGLIVDGRLPRGAPTSARSATGAWPAKGPPLMAKWAPGKRFPVVPACLAWRTGGTRAAGPPAWAPRHS